LENEGNVYQGECREFPFKWDLGDADGKIKYFRIADGILDSAMEEQEKARAAGRNKGGARGKCTLMSNSRSS